MSWIPTGTILKKINVSFIVNFRPEPIMEEFKSGKVRLQMMLDDSKYKVIKSLNPTLKTGRK